MKYELQAYNIWEQGPREKQEDSIFPKYKEINDDNRLFVLCDGMGGHSSGEVASSTVCEAMGEFILKSCPDSEGDFNDDIFLAALDHAYNELDKMDNGAEKKIGTTLTFLKLHSNGATIAHIGDSRVYHIRPGVGPETTSILFQTIDHSLVNDLIKIGELTPEEAKHSNQKNVITRAMQPCMDHRCKADIYHTADIRSGDYFLLCSDGILEQMEDENIKYIFSEKGGDDQKKLDIIINATSQNHDNHSAIIVHITDTEGTANILPEPLMAEVEISDVPELTTAKPLNSKNIKKKDGKGIIVSAVLLLIVLLLIGYSVYQKHRKNDEEATPSQQPLNVQKESPIIEIPVSENPVDEINQIRETIVDGQINQSDAQEDEFDGSLIEPDEQVVEPEEQVVESGESVVESEEQKQKDEELKNSQDNETPEISEEVVIEAVSETENANKIIEKINAKKDGEK